MKHYNPFLDVFVAPVVMLLDPRVQGDGSDQVSFPYLGNRQCGKVKAICSSGLYERDHLVRPHRGVGIDSPNKMTSKRHPEKVFDLLFFLQKVEEK